MVRSRFGGQSPFGLLLLGSAVLCACNAHHDAPVVIEPPPPPRVSVVHSGRLWIEFRSLTDDVQCAPPPAGNGDDAAVAPVCFSGVRAELARALVRGLAPSFREVAVRGPADGLEPGDYVLMVRADTSVNKPASEPGYATEVRAEWRLVRDGFALASERVETSSPGEFAYGSALGRAAGSSLAAVARHIAARLSSIPERLPEDHGALPRVSSRGGFGFTRGVHDGVGAPGSARDSRAGRDADTELLPSSQRAKSVEPR